MRLAGLKRQAQRLARPKQMLLADHLVRRTWAKLLGERAWRGKWLMSGALREQNPA
jgi:hypothetical protein